MKIISKILLCALFAPLAMLTACNNDDPNTQIETFLAFATLTENNDNGCAFTTQEKEDSELVTFTSTQTLDKTNFKKGERYLLSYANDSGKRFQSGEITIFAIQYVCNGDAQPQPFSLIESNMADPMRVSFIERSGTYLNIGATAPCLQNFKFGLYVDETTVDNEYPEAYIIFKSDNLAATDQSFYASLDLSPVWNKSTCKGLNINYNTSTGAKAQLFKKGTTGLKPME